MSNQIKAIVKAHNRDIARRKEIKLRKHLNADALLDTMKTGFDKIEDHRPGNVQHSLGDALMSGFAVFSLKDPSLLAFDERRFKAPHNLMTIYGMGSIPYDTSMREILDGIDPNDLRPLFKDAFRPLQRGKALDQLVFMEGCYLLNLDGTGFFLPASCTPMPAWKRFIQMVQSAITCRLLVQPLFIRITRKSSPFVLK